MWKPGCADVFLVLTALPPQGKRGYKGEPGEDGEDGKPVSEIWRLNCRAGLISILQVSVICDPMACTVTPYDKSWGVHGYNARVWQSLLVCFLVSMQQGEKGTRGVKGDMGAVGEVVSLSVSFPGFILLGPFLTTVCYSHFHSQTFILHFQSHPVK